jgi:hypothetical protein
MPVHKLSMSSELSATNKNRRTHLFSEDEAEYPWLKSKGYIHITPQLNVNNDRGKIITKVTNPDFIKSYAFYPLIHTIIKERRYKKYVDVSGAEQRAHAYIEKGVHKRGIKNRPLHYATHFDAIIFGYYADVLQGKYEAYLKDFPILSNTIIAYRKLPVKILTSQEIEAGKKQKNKGTIHFADEVFKEIQARSFKNGSCAVMTFDIKGFFSSLNHDQLKKSWEDILNVARLSPDHYNVFLASTKFSYIMRDDLRVFKGQFKKSGFDEQNLARIRNTFGINAFFESAKAFRTYLKEKKIRICKFPFRSKKTNQPIGIPQGLPISAILANLYMLSFDKQIYEGLILNENVFYRRYSDDIVVVCDEEQSRDIERYIKTAIEKIELEVSHEKTERFVFKQISPTKLECLKITTTETLKKSALHYLGFEFNGQTTLIKSANLGRFYRRMIQSVKSKASRARRIYRSNPTAKLAVFRRQLIQLYSDIDLETRIIRKRLKRLKLTPRGDYQLFVDKKDDKIQGNYFSYARRASEIMNEPKIFRQLRKHRSIFNRSIRRHLSKAK